MSIVDAARLEYKDKIGNFNVRLRTGTQGVEIALDYTSQIVSGGHSPKNNPKITSGKYKTSFFDIQTSPSKEIASLAVKKCIEKMKDDKSEIENSLYTLENAFDSRETYEKLTECVSNFIDRALEEHEKAVKIRKNR
jgi:hypothetical protein